MNEQPSLHIQIVDMAFKAIEENQLHITIAGAIPIYTRKKPNPKSGKADCRITVREKEHYRTIMKMKMEAAATEEARQKVINHYTNLFNG